MEFDKGAMAPIRSIPLIAYALGLLIVIGNKSALVGTNFGVLFSLLLFSVFSLAILRKALNYVILSFFLFYQATLVFSVAFLDFGAYAPEVTEYTRPATHTTTLFLCIGFFVASVIVIAKYHPLRSALQTVVDGSAINYGRKIGFYIFIGFSVIVLLMHGLFYGFPLLDLTKRFEYWTTSPFSWIGAKILYLLPFSAFFLGRLSVLNRESKRFAILVTLTLFLVALLYANKFTWFINYALMYSAGVVTNAIFNKSNFSLFRRIRLFAIISFFLLILASIGYHYLHNYSGVDIFDIVVNRIFTMQGQVWWFVADSSNLRSKFSSINFYDIFNQESPKGIFLLMEHILPYDTFQYYFENQIPLSMGFPAIMLFDFGFLFYPFAAVIYGFIFAHSYLYAIFTAGNFNFLRLILSIFLLSILPWIFSLGSTYIIMSPLFFVVFALTIIDVLFLVLPRNISSLQNREKSICIGRGAGIPH